MDPFKTLDSLAAVTEVVVEAIMKTALIAGCAGLTIICVVVLAARRTRR